MKDGAALVVFDCKPAEPKAIEHGDYCDGKVRKGFVAALAEGGPFPIKSVIDQRSGMSSASAANTIELGAEFQAAYVVWVSVRPLFGVEVSAENLQSAYTWVSVHVSETSDGVSIWNETFEGATGKGVRAVLPVHVDGQRRSPRDTVQMSLKNAQEELIDRLRYLELGQL